MGHGAQVPPSPKLLPFPGIIVPDGKGSALKNWQDMNSKVRGEASQQKGS